MKKEKTLNEKVVYNIEKHKKGDIISPKYIYVEDIKQSLREFANILRNNMDYPEFAKYNEMLLNDLKEIFGEELLK